MKLFLIIFVSLAVLGGVLFTLMGGKLGGMSADTAAMPVRIEKVVKGDLVEFVTAPGRIEPKTKVSISARVSARIAELPCDEGAEVTKGSDDGSKPASLLVKLDSKDLEAELQSTEARRNAQAAQLEVEKARIEGQRSDLKSLEVDLAKKNLDLKRQKELLSSGDVSQSAVDDLQSAADSLVAKLESSSHGIESSEKNLKVMAHNIEAADAEIAKAKDNLGYTTIYSPIDGTVIKLNSEVGELAVVGVTNSAGTVIMEVADLSKMLLKAEVDEADIGGVKLGQHARIRIQAYPGRIFEGSVTQIALTTVDQPTKHFPVEIIIDTKGDRILSGLTADVDVETAKFESVLKVPSQAVLGRLVDELPPGMRENPNVDKSKTITAVVYKVVDSKAVVVPVKIGASDATHTVVLDGLSEGDTIVTGPYKMLEGLVHEQKVIEEDKVTEEERRAYYQRHQMQQIMKQDERNRRDRGRR